MKPPASRPFALSLSKGRPSLLRRSKKERGFDKLSPNGFGGI